ncbi:MAG: aspartate-semialdehyde dehydrogenase, partial [Deltaproteobacteria bacterium]
MGRGFSVAVCGATGAVGRCMLEVLQQRAFPVARLKLLASGRSAGSRLVFKGESLKVEKLEQRSFGGIDIALFSAG